MIRIGIDPNLIEVGTFTLSWHGFLTFVSVALAVYLVARWAKREGISADSIYSVAVWAIIGGIIGARVVHVIDRWDFYGKNLGEIIAVWNGGIAIYGAIIGGFVGGAIYAIYKKLDVGKLADITAPALLISMAVGRIGDIINGEHIAKTTTLRWGVIYTNPDSPSNQVYGLQPSHPAVAYEMLWDMAVLAVVWRFRDRLKPNGMVFTLYMGLYSLGRFFISFLRIDKDWVTGVGLDQAQFISLIVFSIAILLLVYKARLVLPTPVPTRQARPSSGR